MDKEKVIKAITDKLELTEKEIIELKELTKPISPENAIGRVSRMDAINNKTVNEDALRRAEDRLKRLKYSLDLSQTEKFGKCLRCGTDIPEGRMLLMPESMKCVRCSAMK